ncbi:MAG TPA: hypothetical protein P5120_17385 [Spirochaetota bacterium]|nr:hypothetical protein [Spirochaetota bacterium]HPF07748.1 hypothetical protein [Spirochaetota bacterium]HRX49297.1 hypothetical protein [Spirochaetota bacterium]
MNKRNMICEKCGDRCSSHAFAYYCPECGKQLCGSCHTNAFCTNCWPNAVKMIKVS